MADKPENPAWETLFRFEDGQLVDVQRLGGGLPSQPESPELEAGA